MSYTLEPGLLEPENNRQEMFEYFHGEIVKALTDDCFYRLVYPDDAVNCLDINDIVDEMFDGGFMQKSLMQLIATNDAHEALALRRTVKTLAIQSLAVTWATHETSALIKLGVKL